MLKNLVGRGSTPEPANEIAAAQERYQPWGSYLNQKIAELHTLLGTAEGAPGDTTPPAPADLHAAKPLNVEGFSLVED